MPRTEQTLQLQAANNNVSLFRNVPELDDEGHENDDHYPAHPVGERLVLCHSCQEVWPPPTGATGWPTKTWFLCPNLCNLSQRLAARFLTEMKTGQRQFDERLAERCLERLKQVRKNMRASTEDHLDMSPLDYLADLVVRREQWRRRRDEWTDELDEEFRNFK